MTTTSENASKGTDRKRTLGNTAWLTASALTAKALAYVQFLVMVKAFTESQMGIYAVCLTSVLMAELLANLGFDKVVISKLARERSTEFFETSFLLKGGTSFIAYAVCLTGLRLVYGDELPVSFGAMLAFFAYIPLAAWARSFESHFTAIERMAIPAASQSLERVVMMLAAVLAWWGVIGFDLFLASFMLAGLVRGAIPGWFYLREREREPLRFSSGKAKSLLSASSWMFGVEVLAVIYFRVDIFMLSKMLDMRETGLYLTAYKIFEFFIAVFSGYFTAIFPAMSRSADRLRPSMLILGAVTILLVFTVPVCIWRVPLLELFKPEYAEASQALFYLMLTLPLIYVNTLFALFAVASNQVPRLFAAATAILAVNVLLNLGLIPRMGIQGAALSTLLGEIVLNSMLVFLLRPFSMHHAARATEETA